MTPEYDILVVGAGPSGSTAARLAAQAGCKVLFIDRASFPRDKACATWINGNLFETFPELQPFSDQLLEAPIYGMVYLSPDLARRVEFQHASPVGYVSTRLKFDMGLKQLAVQAGAQAIEKGVCGVHIDEQGVSVQLHDGAEYRGQILIGADGANSRIARQLGMLSVPDNRETLFAIAEDIPLPEETIAKCFGGRLSLYVCFGYEGVGYAWIFPKQHHINLGVGGGRARGREATRLYLQWVEDLKKHGLVPAEVKSGKFLGAYDPMAQALRRRTVGKRTLLVGDAAGFVTGTAAEGIYWSMVSAKLAVQVATHALRTGPIDQVLPTYERLWQKQLKNYIRGLSDGKNADHVTGAFFNVLSRHVFFRKYFSKVFLGLQPPPGWLIELTKLRRRRLLKRTGGETRAEVVNEVETPT
jgi:geranylgeranyl reductase family protein